MYGTSLYIRDTNVSTIIWGLYDKVKCALFILLLLNTNMYCCWRCIYYTCSYNIGMNNDTSSASNMLESRIVELLAQAVLYSINL